ncbi:MAG: PLP-dependent aminotransferase family protein [Chloroflexi bacterium]|nr:PLP-dependent aminotransferase family protein [Chloroflexota bacterium]
MKRSSIREILKLTQKPDIISFAGGLPAPESFPVERVRQAADKVLRERFNDALQYSLSEGLPELRDFIAQRMSRPGLTLTRDNILIVGGAQQAIDMIGRVLLDENDRVVVENPTYLGMLIAWKPYNLRYATVDTDNDGLRVEQVEAIFRQKPKLIYLVPNFQNPQGVTLSFARRRELVRLLNKYQVAVVEDNPYGDLRYSGEDIPSLYELDSNQVIYLGSFSKIVAPGLRVGWVAAPPPILDKILEAKQSTDLHTSPLTQMIIHEVVKDGFLDEHIPRLRALYRQRRDVMLQMLERYFPPEVQWSRPDGGLFLMVTLPKHVPAAELLKHAIQHKVAFVPGDDFHVGEAGRNTLRLNFSNAQLTQIEVGIQRLGNLLKEVLVKEGGLFALP